MTGALHVRPPSSEEATATPDDAGTTARVNTMSARYSRPSGANARTGSPASENLPKVPLPPVGPVKPGIRTSCHVAPPSAVQYAAAPPVRYSLALVTTFFPFVG